MPSSSRAPRRRRRPTAVTIHDVAARAGVSVATVSRVLNRKALVREETSRQVMEVARSLHYVPNIAARALSIRRNHTVGIVLPDVHGQFFSEVIRGIDLAARHAGYHILVSGSHSDRGEMLAVLEAMRGRVDGMVVMSPDVAVTALSEQFVSAQPLVLLNSPADGHDAITIDNHGGALAMMRHLAGLGHTRIAFVKGPEGNADATERLRAYRRALRPIGAVRAAELEFPGDFSEESGFAAGMQILAATPPPTAVFASNDAMAVGVLSALSESGFSVPRESLRGGIRRHPHRPLPRASADHGESGHGRVRPARLRAALRIDWRRCGPRPAARLHSHYSRRAAIVRHAERLPTNEPNEWKIESNTLEEEDT